MKLSLFTFIIIFFQIFAFLLSQASSYADAAENELTEQEASANLPKNNLVPLAKPPPGFHPNGFKIGSKSSHISDLSPAALKIYEICMAAEDDSAFCKKAGLAEMEKEKKELDKKLADFKICNRELDDVKACSERVGLKLSEILEKENEKKPAP